MKKEWKLILALSLVANLSAIYVGYKALEYRAHINYFLDKYTHVSTEFSGRSTFEAENLSLKSDSTVENRIVFFGTQVINKWELDKYFAGYQAVNRGVVGQRASGFLLRFKPDVIELAPKAVLIEVSSYNLRPENTAKELQDYVSLMAQLARASGIEPILTTMIPPATEVEIDDHDDYSLHDSLAVYNQWITGYCTANNYRCVDFYGVLANTQGYLKAELAANDVEPNDEGYRLLSIATLKAIDQAIGDDK